MGRRAKSPTESVRMTQELARRVRTVAAHRRQSVPDFLDEVFGPPMAALYAGLGAQIAAKSPAPKPRKSPPAG